MGCSLLEKIRKLTDAGIAHKNIQSSECFHSFRDKNLSRIWLRDVTCNCNEPTLICPLFNFIDVFAQGC